MTVTRKKADETNGTIEAVDNGKDGKGDKYAWNLIPVLYIPYSTTFQRKSMPMLALFDSGSGVNAIQLTFVQESELFIRQTDIRVQKIDGITLVTYRIVVAIFLVMDRANRV